MKVKTPFITKDKKRAPKFLIDYPNKITHCSACDINDSSIYTIEADKTTINLIKNNSDYTI